MLIEGVWIGLTKTSGTLKWITGENGAASLIFADVNSQNSCGTFVETATLNWYASECGISEEHFAFCEVEQ